MGKYFNMMIRGFACHVTYASARSVGVLFCLTNIARKIATVRLIENPGNNIIQQQYLEDVQGRAAKRESVDLEPPD